MKCIDKYPLRLLCLLLATQLLSACSFIMGAKPTMPLEQGLTVYTIDKKPAPTVLLFPGCGGLQEEGMTNVLPRKAKWLNEHGFNAVVLDYTKIMGLKTACLGQIKPDSLMKVAFDAFRYTASQPYVDRDHIVLLGWSLGASMALTVAEKLPFNERPNITAVAAYYPGCYEGLEFSQHPTLLLLGMADNVVNPYDCLALAKKSPQKPLVLKTYDGVQHNFDVVEFKEPKTAHFFWKKYTTDYDAEADADAEKTLLQFLKKNS